MPCLAFGLRSLVTVRFVAVPVIGYVLHLTTTTTRSYRFFTGSGLVLARFTFSLTTFTVYALLHTFGWFTLRSPLQFFLTVLSFLRLVILRFPASSLTVDWLLLGLHTHTHGYLPLVPCRACLRFPVPFYAVLPGYLALFWFLYHHRCYWFPAYTHTHTTLRSFVRVRRATLYVRVTFYRFFAVPPHAVLWFAFTTPFIAGHILAYSAPCCWFIRSLRTRTHYAFTVPPHHATPLFCHTYACRRLLSSYRFFWFPVPSIPHHAFLTPFFWFLYTIGSYPSVYLTFISFLPFYTVHTPLYPAYGSPAFRMGLLAFMLTQKPSAGSWPVPRCCYSDYCPSLCVFAGRRILLKGKLVCEAVVCASFSPLSLSCETCPSRALFCPSRLPFIPEACGPASLHDDVSLLQPSALCSLIHPSFSSPHLLSPRLV